MNKKQGLLVYTKSGMRGRTFNYESPVKGKIIVHLETKEGKPVLDEKGNNKKLLCEKSGLTLIGFVD